MKKLAELDELREKKLSEVKQKLAQKQAQEQKRQLAEQKIEVLLKKVVSPEAKTRLKNVKLVNEQLYWTAVQQLFQLYQTGRVSGKITEEQVKKILKALSKKPEINIKRK